MKAMSTTLLTDEEQDALLEVVNIAAGRTAAALSTLTSQRVHIEIPELHMLTLPQLADLLKQMTPGEAASVQQVFGGALKGVALLMLDQTGAAELVSLLLGEPIYTSRLDTSSQEVLVEVGNMLLNACLGSFGNLLKVHLSFSVPRIYQDMVSGILSTLLIDGESITHALMIHTLFHLDSGTVDGQVVILLGVTSLEHLLKAVRHLTASVNLVGNLP